MTLKDIQHLYPSQDGNLDTQKRFLGLLEKLVVSVDELKQPSKAILKGEEERDKDFYKKVLDETIFPKQGTDLNLVMDKLLDLAKGHPYQTQNYLTNAIPLASLPALMGHLLAAMLNTNSIWDVYGPAAAEAEVRVIGMMSKLIGYDYTKSGGYTSWGGQAAVYNSLHYALVRHFPTAQETGIPKDKEVYVFASEEAHFSIIKAVQGMGIGTDHLIKIKANPNQSMNLDDLRRKLEAVVASGGVPLYVIATTGTTDAFGLDDMKKIKEITTEIEARYNLKPIFIHADAAMGGLFSVFNEYDFTANPLGLEKDVQDAIRVIIADMQNLHLADSVCFDFHKLGQTPYLSSLFLVKDGKEMSELLSLEPNETPYIGDLGYGAYHTSYTLECSRMASAISIYAATLAFGVQGFQELLANYVRVTLAFRRRLLEEIPNVAVINRDEPGPLTTFRFYKGKAQWEKEIGGLATEVEVKETNAFNAALFEVVRKGREYVFFGDTEQMCLVDVVDSYERQPVNGMKAFVISPYTEVGCVEHVVRYLKEQFGNVMRGEEKVVKA